MGVFTYWLAREILDIGNGDIDKGIKEYGVHKKLRKEVKEAAIKEKKRREFLKGMAYGGKTEGEAPPFVVLDQGKAKRAGFSAGDQSTWKQTTRSTGGCPYDKEEGAIWISNLILQEEREQKRGVKRAKEQFPWQKGL